MKDFLVILNLKQKSVYLLIEIFLVTVTQTEYVYETASEDENEPQNKIAKKEPTKQPLEKKPSNNLENEISPNKAAKGKKGGKKAAATANQPTLMNFFKKK